MVQRVHLVGAAMLLIVAVLTTSAYSALPNASITGVPGGAHWLWVEAEDTTSKPSSAWPAERSGLSGRPVVGLYSSLYVNGLANWAEWSVAVPAAMSAPRYYTRYFAGRSETVGMDGGAAVAIPQDGATGWGKAELASAITAGSHTFRQVWAAASAFYYDGWLLYDGDIATYPTVSGGWLNPAGMVAANYPTIAAGPVTPSFAVTGIEDGGVNYYYSKDGGGAQAYTQGTAFEVPGTYRVWAAAYSSTQTVSGTVYPRGRTLAGVDFTLTVVPEPGSLLALACGLAGMAGFVRYKKN